ncbi:MAG: hypothetical protein R3C49_25835 [Planctomycetaceae bacterium]
MTKSGRDKPRRIHALAMVILLIVAAFVPSTAMAEVKPPLRMRLEHRSLRGRSGGPIPVRIKLEYNLPQMMEGDLELKIYNSDQTPEDLIAVMTYEGIVLQSNDYFFDVVLPPFEHSRNRQYLVEGWFVTDKERISLSRDPKNPFETTELLSINPWDRATLMCSVSGAADFQQPSDNRRFLNSSLRLNNYNPLEQKRQDSDVPLIDTVRVQDHATSWDAIELPEDPLQLCSFDLVLLADGALSRLDAAQLTALTTWVRAGGSLCVLPDDRSLKGPHLQFLQTMFERSDDADLHLTLNDDGELVVISSRNSPVVNRMFGLGRVTLLPAVDEMSSILKDAALGEVVAHLWKVHKASPIRQGKPWSGLNPVEAAKRAGMQITPLPNGQFQVPDPGGYGQSSFGGGSRSQQSCWMKPGSPRISG